MPGVSFMLNRFAKTCQFLMLCAVSLWAFGSALALTSVAQDAAGDVSARLNSPYRRLAEGVETTVPPDLQSQDILTAFPLTSLLAQADLAWNPNLIAPTRTLLAMTDNAQLYREAWCLEFTFKPLRMIEVDVPQPSGKMQKKLIWYMVYRITNTGARLGPEETPEELTRAAATQGKPVQLFPQFVLESQDVDRNGNRVYKAYLDRIIPAAVGPIQRREDPNRELLTTTEIAGKMLPVSTGRPQRSMYGVAMWEDVDPRIDFFSIYVEGLSNAFRSQPSVANENGEAPAGHHRVYRKMLQLNFWRPGDQFDLHEDEIRFGVPKGKADLYDSSEGVAYRWTYR